VKLHDLRPAPGAHTARTRVGRGIAAGKGKTAGRGTKGQKSRAGASIPAWFEGGQTPLHIRVPKLHGFKRRGRIEYQVVNVGRISEYAAAGRFGEEPGDSPLTVNPESLRGAGLISTDRHPVKVLGHGDVTVRLFVVADAFTKSARTKIEAAAGFVHQLAREGAGAASTGDDSAAVEPVATAASAAPEAPATAEPAKTAPPATSRRSRTAAAPPAVAAAPVTPATADDSAASADEPVAAAESAVAAEPETHEAAEAQPAAAVLVEPATDEEPTPADVPAEAAEAAGAAEAAEATEAAGVAEPAGAADADEAGDEAPHAKARRPRTSARKGDEVTDEDDEDGSPRRRPRRSTEGGAE
jgi:large subunit ribosomal protein L15